MAVGVLAADVAFVNADVTVGATRASDKTRSPAEALPFVQPDITAAAANTTTTVPAAALDPAVIA